ncbi:hypothetical protein [Nocardia farcinica]|uniref:hypothetical protein n=1 Tax=Nocardia farcinica TaxID=37329 RepID=UPI002456E703|nr:hypothetical protein [Nocardia farcinica]
MDEPTLYIIDRVVLRPGTARAFLDAYLTGYAPGARDRGLELERVLVSPPVCVEDETNTVTATWTVTGTAGWWAAAIAGRHDPAPARWWESMAPMIVERSRSMAGRAEDLEGLCDV